MVKLVVHIGHGKTGSSSIQKTLLHHAAEISSQGIKYLGLMLEHASNSDRKRWQFNSGSEIFFGNTENSTYSGELLDVLIREIEILEFNKYKIAIWSNEWLATRFYQVMPALLALMERGANIEIQCYVRRHDEWAQSAYLQWGLKHKTYNGPLRDFERWLPVFGQRDLRFAPSLKSWDSIFDSRLRVFNYDSAGDVVEHFLHANGILGVVAIRDNVTPDSLLLAAQSVFNGRANGHVLPTAFDPIHRLARNADENRSILPPLDSLTATEEMLADIVASRRDDIDEINRFLLRSGEPPLSFDKPVQQAPHPSPWEMDQLILKLVYSLAEETFQLKTQVAALQAEIDKKKGDKAN